MSDDQLPLGTMVWTATWNGPRGTISLERVTAQVSCATFSGVMPEETQPWVTEHLPRLLTCEAPHKVVHFIDLGALTSPNGGTRNAYISTLLEHRSQIAAIHCYFDASSLLNSLMVTAANVALGGAVTIHKDRERFLLTKDNALRAELHRAAC